MAIFHGVNGPGKIMGKQTRQTSRAYGHGIELAQSGVTAAFTVEVCADRSMDMHRHVFVHVFGHMFGTCLGMCLGMWLGMFFDMETRLY